MSHYEVLGVPVGAPTSEVRRAYVELARQHHPDRDGGDADAMRAINDAWATLGDPERRATYDRSLSSTPVEPPTPEPRVRTDAEDLLADLLDDTPIGGQVVLPRWFALLPVATFAASIAMFIAAVLFSSPVGLLLAAFLFLLSVVMFLVAPFVALIASRRGG